jgi:hypothetical protein
MKISRDTLSGYILEEVLAYLIRNTGYRLLVNDTQDPQELGWRNNGLVVKGRGGVHQVDVLGELSWVPAFTYPLRLFVEAKFRRLRTGIPEVRNMVATLLDVNQNNLPQMTREAGTNPQLRPKYYYAGAIFSASGFSVPAMDMALAHNVSLIDLKTPEFQPLLDAVTATADLIVRKFAAPGDNDSESEATDDEDENVPPGLASPANHQSRSFFMLALRTAIRQQLKTLTQEPRPEVVGLAGDLVPTLRTAVKAATGIGELFVGMGQGPYMLVLKADSPTAFLTYARAHLVHDVSITWTTDRDDGIWQISPVMQTVGTPYRLSFRVPKPIRDWVFSSENVRRAALDAKKLFFSNICIFYSRDDRDLLIRLRFKPSDIRRRIEP